MPKLKHTKEDRTKICIICGINFYDESASNKKVTCSKECAIKASNKKRKNKSSAQKKEILEKTKKTCLEKYGTEYPAQNKKILNKMIKTNIEKYGVSFPIQNEKVREKQKNTCLEKYGYEYASQTKEFKDRKKNTSIKKYGYVCSLSNKKIQEKTKKTCLEKYDYEYASQAKEFKEKVKNTCLKKYGTTNVLQVKAVQEKVKQTCLEKYGYETNLKNPEIKKKISETKIKKGLTKLVDGKTAVEWAKDPKLPSHKTISDAIKKGIHPSNLKSGRSLLEIVIKNFLETIGLINNLDFINDKILPEHKGMSSERRRPDFLIPKLKLIIECDGEYYHDPEKDKIRNKEYRDLGYKVICFSGNEIDNNFDYVKYKIRKKIMILKYFKSN